MYLTANLPRHITTLGGVLLLTDYITISQLLKCTVSPPHFLIRLQGPQICGLILFWKPIIPETLLYASICTYLKQQRVGYFQTLTIVVEKNPILGVALQPTSSIYG